MCLVGIVLAAIFLLTVLRWWSEGIFEASDAFLLVVVFGGLIFGLFTARSLQQFAIVFVALAGIGAYAIYSYRLGGLRAHYKQSCADYMRAIQADPRNLAARQALAEALYVRGELDKAIDEMQAAANLGAGIECEYKLRQWSKERNFRDSLVPICRWCWTENAVGARKCAKCGSDLPYENPLSRWLAGGRGGSRFYLIVAAGVTLVCVSLLVLPLKFAFLPLGLCLISLMGWWLIASARA